MEETQIDPAYTTATQSLTNLFDRSLFRQAYDSGFAQFGQIHQWPTAELQLLGARLLTHLGLDRHGDACILRQWRSCRDKPPYKLAHFYISALHRWHGPLTALEALDQIEKKYGYSSADGVDLQLQRNNIYMAYRDFSAADSVIAGIPEEQKNLWVRLQQVELKFAQDEYEQALQLAEALLADNNNFRSGIQTYAQLLNLLGRTNDAITTLKTLWDNSESWWVGRQLFTLLLENKFYREAEVCLERLKTLPPFTEKGLDSYLNQMTADLLCAQERYEESLPYLEQKSPFRTKVKSNLEKARDLKGGTNNKKVLDVPFVRQAHMTCAPASIAAVTRFWGRPIEQSIIIDEICYGGTQNYDERLWAIKNHWYCVEFDLKFSTVKALINIGVPVLLSTVEPGSAHLQIIVGYDENMGTYLFRDPYYFRLQEFLVDETEKYYAASGPRCMIIAPKDKQSAIENIELSNKELYDVLFQIEDCLLKNNREDAQELVDHAKFSSPNHRLTLVCERSLAIYDRDEAAILAATEKLLEQFPDDVNYQLSKATSLLELRSSREALNYLKDISRNGSSHLLIETRLANELSKDHRELKQTDRLFHKLLRRSPTNVQVLYGYAGTLWDKQEYQKSLQFYRFCSCLEITQEKYAKSYFNASRFLKITEEALQFLADRFQRFGRKNCGPIISLYSALDTLDRTSEAISYLHTALEWRPDDGFLLLFAARKMAYLNKREDSHDLLKRAKPHVNLTRFCESAMEIYEFQLDYDNALHVCQTLLSSEPLNYQANHAYARLISKSQNNAAIIEHFQQQLKIYPGNGLLQRLLIQWIDAKDTDHLLEACQKYIDTHPYDSWGKRNISEIYLNSGDLNSALDAALEAISIDRNDHVNFGYLGDVYIAMNQLEKANQAFKEAIKLSCDYSYAYEKLLKTSLDLPNQKANLKFIYDELMRQVSFGEGIIEFESVASHYLESNEIEKFLRFALDERPDLWQSWVAYSIHLRKCMRLPEALQVMEQAIERFPLLPRMYLEKSETHRILHEDDKAIEALKYTLELAPNWIWASNKLCQLYEKMGDFNEAIRLQEQAIKSSPAESTPYGYLADLYLRTGRTAEAIDTLYQAIDRNHSYSWAWENLFKLERDNQNATEVLDKLTALIKKWPENGNLVEIYTRLEPESEKCCAALEEFLKRHPHDTDRCINLIHAYVEQRDFDKARDLTLPNYWNNRVPLAIEANRAWICYKEDNLTSAIQLMKDVAEKNPNYYDAWRFLAAWYDEVKNKEGVAEAVKHCARLYPHEQNVLCYCAEKLQSVAGDPRQIGEYLKHAFELDPSDQYVALTYIDHALDQKDIAAAEAGTNLLLKHRQGPYVYHRCIQLALSNKNIDGAMEYFKKSLLEFDLNSEILLHTWKAFKASNLQIKAAELIDSLLNSGEKLDPNAGYCLGQQHLATQSIKRFQKKLLAINSTDIFWHRYTEAYLRLKIDEKTSIPSKVEQFLRQAIQSDTVNWGLLGFQRYITRGNEHRAREIYRGIELRPDVQPWHLYYASISNRWTGHWSEGETLMAKAYQLPADHYRADIILWKITDDLINDRMPDSAPLQHLHLGEIEPMSNYTLSAAKALVALQGRRFDTDYKVLSPYLRDCQHHAVKSGMNVVTQTVRVKLRYKFLLSFKDLPFWKRVYWRFMLTNHF